MGGVFHGLVTTSDLGLDLDSSVRAVDRATGTYRAVLDHLPYRFTG